MSVQETFGQKQNFTPVIPASTSFTAGKVIGYLNDVFADFRSGVDGKLKSGFISSIALMSVDALSPACTCLFFSEEPDASIASFLVNGTPTIDPSDIKKIIGHIAILSTDYADIGGVRIGTVNNLNLPVYLDNYENGTAKKVSMLVIANASLGYTTANPINMNINGNFF